ncbi:MAG TPA: glycoside hydrolase family 9 protein [Pseudobacteroides sp.]|uniref:glycoside hydrolase family 9 protein n=1 Tax=Pseudobacteroides sp. TaxID=1968840 RepID=UPI002F91DD28
MKRISKFFLVLFVLVCIIPKTPVSAAETNFNYVDAFAKSILFYEASWCGPDAGNNRIKWRGPCHIEDGKDVGLDLTGGFHDCGDHVKFGLPQCYSASALAWNYYEFKDVFIDKGQDKYMLNILKHFTDYFLKCFPNKTTFYYQFGEGNTDHAYWGPPELQTYNRPTYFVATPEKPGSDVAGDAAAALALMYLNYKDIDLKYAEKCLAAAKDLYDFGITYRGNSEAQGFYVPSGYYDELMWGATWLYIITNDKRYMDDIYKLMNEKGMGGDNEYQDHWTNCWDYVFSSTFLKLSQISDDPKFKRIALEHMDYWMNTVKTTPGGLKWLTGWGVCKYPAAESMIMLVHYKNTGEKKYLDFAKGQIDYILGKNPKKMSYMVGFGDNYPKFPHHRAASGMLEGWPGDETKQAPERHILYGALVGGADANDEYIDDVEKYVYTETGLDYNAGLVGALAGLSKYYGDGQVPEETPGIEGEPPQYYAEARVTKEDNQVSEVEIWMHNILTSPPQYETGLSLKYFIDLSEFGPGKVNLSTFMQNAYWSPNGAKMSPIKPWDEAKNIYYVDITFPDQKLYGKSYVQFFIANYNGTQWNASNDYSRAGLNEKSFTITQNIPVYKNGEQVFGKDPSGGTPSVPPSPTAKPTATTGYKISGFIKPDMTLGADTAGVLRSGFKVEVIGSELSAETNQNGYFEIDNVPQNAVGYTLKVSKKNYLYREIKNVLIAKDVQISTQSVPIIMWPGDLEVNGVQDNAINLSDIIEIAKHFNSTSGDGKYKENGDLNRDGAINMSDVIIIAMHFNKVPEDYM